MSIPATKAGQKTGGLGEIKNKLFNMRYISVIASMVLFLLAFLFGGLMFDGFASTQTFFNLFIDNAFLIVSATGMTLVLLSGGIDLSVGSVLALTTMIISYFTEVMGWNPWLAILAALAVGVVLGFLMGKMVTFLGVPPFIATLSGMFFARGACYLISITSVPINNEALRSLALWKWNIAGGFITVNVIVALAVVLLAMYVTIYTKFGRSVYTVGGNEYSAMLMGIPVKRVKTLVYMINGGCSALAGVVFSLYMLSGYALHCQGMEMDAIAACVIGGTLLTGGVGYVFGTLFGVLTLGIIQALIMFDGTINSWWTKITVGILLLVFIGLQRLIVAATDKAKA